MKSGLSVQEIKQLQKDLMQYRDSLTDKCRKLTEELAKIGANVINAKVSESPLGEYVTLQTDITEEKTGCKAILITTGEVKEQEGYAPFNILLAIEFGAGIHYNKEENPKEDEFGYGVGTFPGQIHAWQDEGWYYWDEESKQWRHTYGVKATMPMYNAGMEIQKKIIEIAKEVFG